MLVKGQRRRISPRTRRRCIAIRGFFKKALDTCTTTSQYFTKCGSTVIDNNLNKKIVELERRLYVLSKASLDKQCIIETSNIEQDSNATNSSKELDNDIELSKRLETEVLYKTPENRYKRCSSRPSQNFSEIRDSENILKLPEPSVSNISKSRNRKKKKHKTNQDSLFYGFDHVAQNYSVYYQENEQYIKNHRSRKHSSEHRHKSPRHIVSDFNEEGSIRHNRKRAKRSKLTKQTSSYINYENNLNPNHIAQIVQNQYESIDVLDKKVSEISQFSVPVCRDRLSLENTTVLINNSNEDTKDVVHEQKKKRKRMRKPEPENVTHQDCDVYDFIPVKEMSTPKSRRKFVEDQMIATCTHREVPPSPRTNRPRLNLTIKHYTDDDDYQNIVNDSNENNNVIVPKEGSEIKLTLKDEATLAENVTAYETFTEKPTTTLDEIKETLQRFLQEVQDVKSFHQILDNNHQQHKGFVSSNAALPMINSCYYPVVPICPVNYMQSAFVPSTSTCAACAHSKESEGTVAEQLIQQIHQNAVQERYDNSYQNQANRNSLSTCQRPLTSRSAGSGRVLTCCDVDVQIPTLKCISNSSATIGSKINSKKCNSGTKGSIYNFDMDELNLKLQPVTSESVMEYDNKEIQNDSSRWKRFFKSLGTGKKCNSTTRNDDSSPHLPNANLLHNSPSIMLDCKSLSQKSSNEDIPNMSPYSCASHYINGFYLKEVQVKCVATQSERPKRYIFGLFSKRQSDKVIYSKKTK